MKALCLCTLFTLTLFFSANSQNVFPDVSNNQYWEVVTWNFFGGFCRTNKIKTGVEFTICNKNYIEVLECDANLINCVLIGYYRVVGDSVMVRSTTDCSDEEGLMYDFTMLNMDTVICAFNWNLDSTKFWKTGEQNINYEGTVRKTFDMNYYPQPNMVLPPIPIYQMNWIAGIGSNVHPFYPFSCIGDHCEQEQQLVRVVENGEVIYLDTALTFSIPCSGWDTTTSTTEIEKSYEEMEVLIYPNPIKDRVSINIQNFLRNENMHLSVIDVYGKVLVKTLVHSKRTEIDLSHLSNGLYFIEINKGGKKIIKIIVKE
jgi:hypothetical protein